MTAKEFIRACYLNAEPSVDVEDESVKKIDCTKHTLKESVYENLVNEYAGDDHNKRVDCAMWCLCSGPQLVAG